MEYKLSRDSLAALKQMTQALNRLIDALVSLHGSIESNTAIMIDIVEKRGGK